MAPGIKMRGVSAPYELTIFFLLLHFFYVPFIVFALTSSLLPINGRHSDPGSHSRPSSPLRTTYCSCLAFFYRDKILHSSLPSLVDSRLFAASPFGTAVPIWGQTSLIPSRLPLKRDCCPKRLIFYSRS